MTTRTIISSFVGAALSILLRTVPFLKRWWESQRGKVLILLTLHLGGYLGLWYLGCKAGIGVGVTLDCSRAGMMQMGWDGIMGFAGNQAAYGLAEYGKPAVQSLSRKVSSLRAEFMSR